MSSKPSSAPALKRLNVQLPSELHQAFKAATAAQGRQMTDVAMELISRYVQEHQRRGGTRK